VRPDRWQVILKAAEVAQVDENPRRTRDKGMWEQPGNRDAWVTSFLASLTRSGSAPHFPLPLGTSHCLALPKEFSSPAIDPRSDMGYLPVRSKAMQSVSEFSAAVDEGRASEHSWLVTASDNWQASLEDILSAYRGAVLSEGFARGLMFQLIFALGSARHAFGFHHNDMATLSNVKLYQVPYGSLERQSYWCYTTNPGALAMLPLIFRDEAATGKDGKIPGTRRRDRLYELIDGVDACATEKPPLPPRFQEEGAASLLQEEGAASLLQEEGAASLLQEEGAVARTSWCVPSAAIDGLRVVLSNFEVSSLTRTQLDWWRAGYSFPNTAWRDDLQDLAGTLCGRLSSLVEGGSKGLDELCERMRQGSYADRPLMALEHPWFSLYPKVLEVHPAKRQTFIYTPLTIADMPENQGLIKKGGAGSGGSGGAGSGSGGSRGKGSGDAERATRRSEKQRRKMYGAFAGLLGLLTPPPPWVQLDDGSSMTLEWTAHKAPIRPLAPTMPYAPEAFGLLQDRISVYSGASYTFVVPSTPKTECHVFRVVAYYHALGWTPQSDPLYVGDCSSMT
jgi:hypothetical protein